MTELKSAIIAYIEFLSLPSSERQKNYGYTLKSAYARANNVSHNTLNRWEKKEGFKEKLEELETKALNNPIDSMKAIFKNLEARAVEGEKKAVDLYIRNIDLIKSTLESDFPTWEGLIDQIDRIEEERDFKKRKII